ncbi:MAG: hypothetical protein ACM31D_04580 [Bacteroidota bacterium]
MAKAVLSFINHVADAGTALSTNSEVDGLGVGNLGQRWIQQVWRSSTGVGRWVKAEFPTACSVGVVALAMPRSGFIIPPTDLLRLEIFDAGGGGIYDTGPVPCGIDPRRGYWFHRPPVTISAGYCKVTIESSAPYVQAGVLWAGEAVQPKYNFGWDWSTEWVDASRKERAPKSGVLHVDSGPRYRRVSVAFNNATASDADAFEEGDIISGHSGQILLCTNPDDWAKRTLLGTAEHVSPITQARFPLYSKPYVIEEDL